MKLVSPPAMTAVLVIQENKNYEVLNSFLIFTGFLVFLSCRPTRKIQTVIAKKDTTQTIAKTDSKADSVRFVQEVFNKFRATKIEFKTFSAKLKVDYTDKAGKGPDLTVVARIQKDSIIWLSINATVFSYEAFRVMITPDSVIVLNKKTNWFNFGPLVICKSLLNFPLTFTPSRTLLLGNPIYLDSNIVSFKKTNRPLHYSAGESCLNT